ncbi:MAG: HD domain-containing protein [Bacilli bacterium]|nr:HD domain-containing protein [Bacilli bacterium]
MDKINAFNKEINYIKNNNFKDDVTKLINKLPDYFFEIEASSTGKYHPKYTLGVGGLLRHTKAAVRIAYELLNNPTIGDKYTNDEKDLMLIGLILHDGLKSGEVKEKYTKVDHPLLVANFIEENKNELSFKEEEITLLKSVISSHMGPWNKDYNDNEILPKPKTKYENFVHMCDYLASRKALLFEFDNDNNIID